MGKGNYFRAPHPRFDKGRSKSMNARSERMTKSYCQKTLSAVKSWNYQLIKFQVIAVFFSKTRCTHYLNSVFYIIACLVWAQFLQLHREARLDAQYVCFSFRWYRSLEEHTKSRKISNSRVVKRKQEANAAMMLIAAWLLGN